jgi:hypothetical protein
MRLFQSDLNTPERLSTILTRLILISYTVDSDPGCLPVIHSQQCCLMVQVCLPLDGSIQLTALLVDGPELNFHPDFSKRDTSDILRSSDGIHFYYLLSKLALVSSFFDTARSIIHNDKSIPLNERITDLPSAKTKGLAIVLSALNDSIEGRQVTVPRYYDITALIEVFEITKAYDLPLVTNAILHQAIIDWHAQPFHLYAAAALATNEPIAAYASRLTLPFDVDDDMPMTAADLLNHAPMYKVRLRELHLSRSRNYAFLKTLILSTQPIPDHQDFVKACIKSKGCDAIQSYDGNFGVMREKIGNAVYARFVATGGGVKHGGLQDIVMNMTGCDKCAMRLGRCFASAIRNFEEKGTRDTI